MRVPEEIWEILVIPHYKIINRCNLTVKLFVYDDITYEYYLKQNHTLYIKKLQFKTKIIF